MAGYGYNFEHQPRYNGRKKRPWRVVWLFVLFAGITGAIIWWVLPNSAKSQISGQTDSSIKKAVPSSESLEPSPPLASNVIGNRETITPDVNNPVPAGSEDNKTDNSGTISTTETNSNEKNDKFGIAGKDEKGSVSQAENKTDISVEPKGKISPNDPPIEQDQPVLPKGTADSEISSQLAAAEQDFAEGRLAAAATAAYQLLSKCKENSTDFLNVADLITKANCKLALKGVVKPPNSITHNIVSGNTINTIAAKYHTGKGMIVRSNGLKSDKIFVGKKLTVFPGPWSIKIEKTSRLLKLYQHVNGTKKLFAMFRVGVGRFGRTPSADFVVSSLERHPTWYAPDGRVYKYGESGNELGDYFLKLATPGSPANPLKGYGIHGTRDERTVGRSLSNGCIRMRNHDVELLYLLIPRRTPVKIVE